MISTTPADHAAPIAAYRAAASLPSTPISPASESVCSWSDTMGTGSPRVTVVVSSTFGRESRFYGSSGKARTTASMDSAGAQTKSKPGERAASRERMLIG